MNHHNKPDATEEPGSLDHDDIVGKVSGVSLPELNEVNKSGVITNRIPAVILPEEIATTRLIIRRDRQSHFEELGVVIDHMRQDGNGFDCVVVCGKEKFSVHRCVLSAHSDYFQRILYDSGDKLMVDVPTDGIPSQGMLAIINYMYSGELRINYENAVDTLATANILEMTKLVEKCSDFINTLLADENLMTTLELAERTGINPLYAEAYKRLARNFYVQTKLSGFLLWDIEKVCRLLANDHIVIETEVHVFTAAMRWTHHKENERQQYFKRLMDCVRWVYMTTEELMNCVDQESDVLKQPDVLDLLIDANWYTTLQSYNFTWKEYVIPLPRIRSLRKEDPDVVVQRMRVSLVERHSSHDQVWRMREPASAFIRKRTGFPPAPMQKPVRILTAPRPSPRIHSPISVERPKLHIAQLVPERRIVEYGHFTPRSLSGRTDKTQDSARTHLTDRFTSFRKGFATKLHLPNKSAEKDSSDERSDNEHPPKPKHKAEKAAAKKKH